LRARLSTVISQRQAWLTLLGLPLIVGAGMSAHAGLRAIEGHPADAAPAFVTATGYEADEHFPGAAALYAEQELAAPAAGVTGTTALPDMPVPALAPVDESISGANGIVPAQPFSFGKASTTDRGRALECLTAAVYYEAASEPDEGQQAVAQVVLNRARHPAFPGTVCGVVYQGSERRGCQFSFACDGAMTRMPSRTGWARAARVAAMALAGRVYAPVGLATHYHTYAVTPAWNRSLVMTDVVGAHFFHRWKGWWGTAAAFGQIYVGGEPTPGPHAPVAIAPPVEVPTPTTTAVIAAASPVPPSPVTPLASVRPAYQASGTPLVSAQSDRLSVGPSDRASGDRLPPASTIRPEFANSGTMR